MSHPGAEHSRERHVGRPTLPARVVVQLAAIAITVAVVAYPQRHLFTGFGAIMSRLPWYWVVLAFVAELASIPPLAEAQLIVP